MYNEKEDELNSLAIRHAATEAYVEELRFRVAKLTERESATEVCLRIFRRIGIYSSLAISLTYATSKQS